MSERAAQFLHEFVSDEIHPAGFPQNREEAEQLAEQCKAQAAAKGISAQELELVAGMGLVDYMHGAIEEAVEAEIGRQVAKDRS